MAEIKVDSEMLPQMFRKEVQYRHECTKNMKDAQAEMEKYKKEWTFQKNQIDDLQNDKTRKERLALLTQAAWGNIKQHLDDEKNKNNQLGKKIDDLLSQLQDAHNDVAKFK